MDKEKSPIKASTQNISVPNIFIAIAVMAIICAVIFYGISLTRNYQLSSTEKKLEDTQGEIEAMGDVDTRAKMASAAVETFSDIDEEKAIWSEFLAEIARKTEVTTRFVQLSMEESGDGITIEGLTESYEGLAKFMTSLRSSERIEDVALISADLGASEGGGIGFVIQASPSSEAFLKRTR